MNPQHGYEHWGRLSEGVRPVCKGGEWFYIDEANVRLTNGTNWKFAWWFDNGLAVVQDELGEYHIDRTFQPLYDQRWAYAGPFGGDPPKAPVRDRETSEEFSIFRDGTRAPSEPAPPVPMHTNRPVRARR